MSVKAFLPGNPLRDGSRRQAETGGGHAGPDLLDVPMCHPSLTPFLPSDPCEDLGDGYCCYRDGERGVQREVTCPQPRSWRVEMCVWDSEWRVCTCPAGGAAVRAILGAPWLSTLGTGDHQLQPSPLTDMTTEQQTLPSCAKVENNEHGA